MSTKAIIAWVLVIIIVAAGVWYFWSQSQNSTLQTSPASQTLPASSTTTSQNSIPQNQQLASGDSNADLDADLNTIDSQTSDANTDSASVNQSFNDQPVQQSQL